LRHTDKEREKEKERPNSPYSFPPTNRMLDTPSKSLALWLLKWRFYYIAVQEMREKKGKEQDQKKKKKKKKKERKARALP